MCNQYFFLLYCSTDLLVLLKKTLMVKKMNFLSGLRNTEKYIHEGTNNENIKKRHKI